MDEAPTHREPDIPYGEFECTVLLGFEQDPGPSIYPKLDALGGVVLEERKYLEGGWSRACPGGSTCPGACSGSSG